VRVKGGKGSTVPAKQSPAVGSARAGQKRSRTEDVPSQAPAEPSAASLNGKGQEQPSNTKQEESNGEPGLAGLLGGHFTVVGYLISTSKLGLGATHAQTC